MKNKLLVIYFIFILAFFFSFGCDPFIPFIVLLFFIALIVNRDIKSLLSRDCYLLLFLFVMIAISSWYNYLQIDNQSLFLKIIANSIVTCLVIYLSFCLGYHYIRDSKRLNYFIFFLLLLGGINGIINVVAWLLQTGGTIGRYNFISPIDGSFSCYITLELYCLILVLSFPFRNTTFKYILFLLFAFNVIIIATRKMQVAALIGLVLFFYNYMRALKGFKKLVLIIFIFSIGIFLLSSNVFNQVSSSYEGMLDSSSDDMVVREIAISDAIAMFIDEPILGKGYGSFVMHNKTTILNSPHNGFFAILSEIGLLGIIFLISIFFHSLKNTYKIVKRKEIDSYLTISIILFLSTILSLFSNAIYLPPPNERSYYLYCSIFWCFWGILLFYLKKINSKMYYE